MTYNLRFHKAVLTEWKKLDATIKKQFKAKLSERLENPRIPTAALSGMQDCYKIKLRSAGYRLIYRVDDDTVYVTVLAVAKRDKNIAYRKAKNRL